MNQTPPKKPEDTQRSRTTPELSLVEDPIPDLKLEDTAAQQRRGLPVKGGVVGYNPYDTGQTVETRAPHAPKSAPQPPPPPHKPTDLRKLSEWIKAQRRAEAVRAEEQAGGKAAKPDLPVAPGVRNPRR